MRVSLANRAHPGLQKSSRWVQLKDAELLTVGLGALEEREQVMDGAGGAGAMGSVAGPVPNAAGEKPIIEVNAALGWVSGSDQKHAILGVLLLPNPDLCYCIRLKLGWFFVGFFLASYTSGRGKAL